MASSVEKMRAILSDEIRGATDIALDAADCLIEALDTGLLEPTISIVSEFRPIMAPLLNLVHEVRSAPKTTEARDKIIAFRSSLVSAPAEAASIACEWIRGLRDRPFRVVTISASVVIEIAIRELHRVGVLSGVIVGESQPACEGRELAKRLRNDIPDVCFTWDAALSGLLRPDCIVMFGADAVTEGAVYNKVGSLMLAQIALANDIPAFAVTTSHKVVPPEFMRTFSEAERAMLKRAEERSHDATVPLFDVRFEAVPRDLLTAVITENGPLPGPIRDKTLSRADHLV